MPTEDVAPSITVDFRRIKDLQVTLPPTSSAAYTSAALGQSSVMLPLRRVFDHANGLTHSYPLLSPRTCFLGPKKTAD